MKQFLKAIVIGYVIILIWELFFGGDDKNH
jgi:hypothetical protein